MPNPFGDLGRCIVDELGAKGAIIVVRRGSGSYDSAGLFVTPAPAQLLTDAAVQPSTPKEIDRLPENERTKEAITIFTVRPLKTSDVNAREPADEVIWQNRRYTVQVVADWSAQAQYSWCVATRVGE